MNRLLPSLLLLALLGTTSALLARKAVRDAQGGETHPVYTTQRYDPWGSAALATVLYQRGIDVRRLERPRVPAGFSGVLLQVAPPPDLSPDDTEANPASGVLAASPLLDWVAQGNTLVHLTRRPTPLTTLLGLSDPHAILNVDTVADYQRTGGHPDNLPGEVVRARWTASTRDGPARQLVLRAPLTLDDPNNARWTPRLSHGHRTLGGVMQHGAGRVVVLGAPTPALNLPLDEADHLPWLLEQLGEGPVLFDGWSHGIGHAGGILETAVRLGLLPLLIQGVVLLGACRWATHRAPAPAPPPPPTPRNAREQIDALARLTRHALPPTETARRTYDLVRARLAEGLRCRPEDVTDRLRSPRGSAAVRAAELLAQAAALATTDRPECPACGHDLAGRTGEACSECGAPLAPKLLRASRRPELTIAAASPNQPRLPALAELLDDSAALASELRRA